MQLIQYVIPAILAISICVLAFLSRQEANRVVQNWVLSQGCEIDSMEVRLLRTGPFSSMYLKRRLIYRVQVKDSSKTPRVVWLRLGYGFSGFFSGEVTAIWE
jgi:hypothetical protein